MKGIVISPKFVRKREKEREEREREREREIWTSHDKDDQKSGEKILLKMPERNIFYADQEGKKEFGI